MLTWRYALCSPLLCGVRLRNRDSSSLEDELLMRLLLVAGPAAWLVVATVLRFLALVVARQVAQEETIRPFRPLNASSGRATRQRIHDFIFFSRGGRVTEKERMHKSGSSVSIGSGRVETECWYVQNSKSHVDGCKSSNVGWVTWCTFFQEPIGTGLGRPCKSEGYSSIVLVPRTIRVN